MIAMVYFGAVTLGCWLAHRLGLALECWWIRRKADRAPHCRLCLRDCPGPYCWPCALAIVEVGELSLRRKS